MNRRRFCPSRACRATTFQSELTVRGVAASVLTVALMLITACARSEPIQKSDSPSASTAPAPQPPPEPNPVGGDLPPEPYLLEGSGVTVWAKEFQGQLIEGLDGALYESYRKATIEGVQKMLRDRGFYAGPVNGILDRPTMKSIYAFQVANDNLPRCGVPTPHTRQMLKQGSHTDLSS
jgi:hypothetical protein